MKLSFIVSTFNRPDTLACLLYSLKIQSERDFEVLVCDNSFAAEPMAGNGRLVDAMSDRRFQYLHTRLEDCYTSANFAAEQAAGEYLCFPSDDGYYVPRFAETMLSGAPADLIYCDCLYDGHGVRYNAMDVRPQTGWIDKGGFLLRRELFAPGFDGPAGADRAADGWLVERAMRAGASAAKVSGFLWVHN